MATRTITLSDRPPVRVSDDAWPVVARAHAGDLRIRWTARVRQHADGRCIVYATKQCNFVEDTERDLRAGYLVPNVEGLAGVIDTVAHEVLAPLTLGRDLLADMPAEEI